jgi:hypothetical protein
MIERPRKLVRSDTAAILACSVRVFLQTGHSPQRPDCAVLRIEKRIAADRDLGIGFGDLTELYTNVALAHVRAHGFREHANADLELSSIACMIEGTPAIAITLPIQKPGAPDT